MHMQEHKCCSINLWQETLDEQEKRSFNDKSVSFAFYQSLLNTLQKYLLDSKFDYCWEQRVRKTYFIWLNNHDLSINQNNCDYYFCYNWTFLMYNHWHVSSTAAKYYMWILTCLSAFVSISNIGGNYRLWGISLMWSSECPFLFSWFP